jgi:hypothetical protein
MYKWMGAFQLPVGTDPEEFWKYHTQRHAQDVLKAAGSSLPKLRRFSVNRINGIADGNPGWWGMVEMWWDDRAAHQEYLANAREFYDTPSGKNPMDDFLDRVNSVWAVDVEEVNIKL